MTAAALLPAEEQDAAPAGVEAPRDEHGNVFADEKGLVDRTLMDSGVRWTMLRWMHRSIRVRLWREVTTRAAAIPPGSRTCWEGAAVWLDEVCALVDAQPWQQRRRDTWTAAAQLLAESARDGMRPLTEISHEKLAAALDVSERYVHTITRWLIEHRLLGQLLSGTRFPRLDIPQDETPAETRARLAREKAAESARRRRREHALAQARAQMAALRDGRPVPPAHLDPYREFRAAQSGDADPGSLMNLASVYELRVPEPVAPPAPEPENVVSLAAARQRRAHTLAAEPPDAPPTCGNVLGSKSSSPTPLGEEKQLTPVGRRTVDKNGRASRGSDKESPARFEGSNQRITRLPIAQRTAQALLEGPVPGWCDDDVALPATLTRGVTRTWLARRIRPLVDAGWDPLELAWHIVTRGGQWQHLPARIPNPAGFIVSSLRTAVPAVRPTAKWAAELVEREQQQRADERAWNIEHRAMLRRLSQADEKRAEGLAKRAAIDACDLCDEHGWLPADDEIGSVRCNHDPDTSGW